MNPSSRPAARRSGKILGPSFAWTKMWKSGERSRGARRMIRVMFPLTTENQAAMSELFSSSPPSWLPFLVLISTLVCTFSSRSWRVSSIAYECNRNIYSKQRHCHRRLRKARENNPTLQHAPRKRREGIDLFPRTLKKIQHVTTTTVINKYQTEKGHKTNQKFFPKPMKDILFAFTIHCVPRLPSLSPITGSVAR